MWKSMMITLALGCSSAPRDVPHPRWPEHRITHDTELADLHHRVEVLEREVSRLRDELHATKPAEPPPPVQ